MKILHLFIFSLTTCILSCVQLAKYKFVNSKFTINNCLFYQVTDSLDYGCSVCNKQYQLTADNKGAGTCGLKNTIPNCLGAQSAEYFPTRGPYCFQCTNNFYISEDTFSCIPLPDDYVKIPKCKNYKQLEDKKIYCNECKSGYTLNVYGQCKKGCSIKNCSNCIKKDSLRCNWCKKGFIGTYESNYTYGGYSSCLSLAEYQKTLITTYK